MEAVIGRTRYTKIETAIDVANRIIGNLEEPVQIDIVTDIVLDNTRGTFDENNEIIAPGSIIIDSSKNIKLNLNGYLITNTENDFVVKNYGKLEIIDSSMDEVEDKTQINGKIDSTTNETVYNEGTLILTSGAITTNKAGARYISNYKYAIRNVGNLTIAGRKCNIICRLYRSSFKLF